MCLAKGLQATETMMWAAWRKSEEGEFSRGSHVRRRRIQDLVNQSGTISSMVETPAMLLHTITTIALLPLVLGNIIQQ